MGTALQFPQLLRCGDDLCAWICRRVPPAASRGMAHGRSGALYAVLRWCCAARRPVPPGVEQQVNELTLLVDDNRGGSRPRSSGSASWCDGSSGYTLLWMLAARCLPSPDQFVRLAEAAAWDAWTWADLVPDLCCGMGGRAYAMLEIYRLTAEPVWLRRAHELAERAADLAALEHADPRRYSLWHGALGIALLGDQRAIPSWRVFQ